MQTIKVLRSKLLEGSKFLLAKIVSFKNDVLDPDVYLQLKNKNGIVDDISLPEVTLRHLVRDAWLLSGTFSAFRPERGSFESHSSRHVGTLDKSFAHSGL